MAVALAVFGFAFAALCVWLGVRIINRRERWAKWTAVALIGVLVAYPLSLGPTGWLYWKYCGADGPSWLGTAIDYVYGPLFWAIRNGPDWIWDMFRLYLDQFY